MIVPFFIEVGASTIITNMRKNLFFLYIMSTCKTPMPITSNIEKLIFESSLSGSPFCTKFSNMLLFGGITLKLLFMQSFNEDMGPEK